MVANFRAILSIDEQFRRGWQARTLAKKLGSEPDPDLGAVAEHFGISREFVYEFNRNNAVEILAIRNNPEDPFAGIWAADRDNRVRELVDEAIDCNVLLRSMRGSDEDLVDSAEWNMIVKLKMALLEAIAKELGQSKPTIDASGGVSFVINGIDLGALQ